MEISNMLSDRSDVSLKYGTMTTTTTTDHVDPQNDMCPRKPLGRH